MTPLQKAKSLVIRFVYTDPRLIPKPFYVNKDVVRDAPFVEEQTRAAISDIFPDLLKEDFVLVSVRTIRVKYLSHVEHYETVCFFRNGGVPDPQDWERMKAAFFALAEPYTWQTRVWFDEKRERYSVLCERPRHITKAKGPTPVMHTGDALLYDDVNGRRTS